ncbi:hypothetical protein EVAR_19416_1 [Eumeta japonica]|uniref:Uncharacterized protein n=1 Tax=Eumeta variegata TaxID=151549 RepID=A0A4C1TRT2_EUMVA|nr:hypothetical protein EVAR_19416_1 [Eumeta japonica]
MPLQYPSNDHGNRYCNTSYVTGRSIGRPSPFTATAARIRARRHPPSDEPRARADAEALARALASRRRKIYGHDGGFPLCLRGAVPPWTVVRWRPLCEEKILPSVNIHRLSDSVEVNRTGRRRLTSDERRAEINDGAGAVCRCKTRATPERGLRAMGDAKYKTTREDKFQYNTCRIRFTKAMTTSRIDSVTYSLS